MLLRSPNHEACLTFTTNGTGRFNRRHVPVSKQSIHLKHRDWSRLAAAQVCCCVVGQQQHVYQQWQPSQLAIFAEIRQSFIVCYQQPLAIAAVADVQWQPVLAKSHLCIDITSQVLGTRHLAG
jgi:hypothetical protein